MRYLLVALLLCACDEGGVENEAFGECWQDRCVYWVGETHYGSICRLGDEAVGMWAYGKKDSKTEWLQCVAYDGCSVACRSINEYDSPTAPYGQPASFSMEAKPNKNVDLLKFGEVMLCGWSGEMAGTEKRPPATLEQCRSGDFDLSCDWCSEILESLEAQPNL